MKKALLLLALLIQLHEGALAQASFVRPAQNTPQSLNALTFDCPLQAVSCALGVLEIVESEGLDIDNTRFVRADFKTAFFSILLKIPTHRFPNDTALVHLIARAPPSLAQSLTA